MFQKLPEYDQLRAGHALAYLRTVHAAKSRLDQMQRRRGEQLERMGIKGMRYTGMPGSPNAYGDAIPDGVARLDAIDACIADAEGQWQEAVAECMRALFAMPTPEYSELLERRYLDGDMWATVAVRMGRSCSWCQYSNAPALVELYGTMPHAYRLPAHQAV